jgi:hypothetical protein
MRNDLAREAAQRQAAIANIDNLNGALRLDASKALRVNV